MSAGWNGLRWKSIDFLLFLLFSFQSPLPTNYELLELNLVGAGLIQERLWHKAARPGSVNRKDEVVVTVREPGLLVWQNRSRVPTSAALRHKTQELARSRFMGTNETHGWLAGTRVVDLANVIAGPTIGGMLSRFGATIIKVDPSEPTYDALVAVFMGVPINTGKCFLAVWCVMAVGLAEGDVLCRGDAERSGNSYLHLGEWRAVCCIEKLHALGVL